MLFSQTALHEYASLSVFSSKSAVKNNQRLHESNPVAQRKGIGRRSFRVQSPVIIFKGLVEETIG